jgi:hypothetical protein
MIGTSLTKTGKCGGLVCVGNCRLTDWRSRWRIGEGGSKKKRGRPVCCRSLEGPGLGVRRNRSAQDVWSCSEGVRSNLPTVRGIVQRVVVGRRAWWWGLRRSCGGATSIGKEKLEGLGLLARRVQGSRGEASGGSIKSGRNARSLVDGTDRFRE